ncbi:MAG: twin-arginine translocation signal domain-containing protein [Armatimonadia bacterium]|nr:twin-arginine translocation signal domain-containing protein [Armatimonadia bacterium]
MDRREFVKMIGAGGVLAGLGAIAGVGCSREVVPVAGPPAEGGENVATCPDCGAKVQVTEWGAKVQCWKCGHVWAPQKGS